MQPAYRLTACEPGDKFLRWLSRNGDHDRSVHCNGKRHRVLSHGSRGDYFLRDEPCDCNEPLWLA